MSRCGRAASNGSSSRSNCRATARRRYGCRSTPNTRPRITTGWPRRPNGATGRRPKRHCAASRRGCAAPPRTSAPNMWRRRTAPISRSCFCRPKGCSRRSSGGRAWSIGCSANVTSWWPARRRLVSLLTSLRMGFRSPGDPAALERGLEGPLGGQDRVRKIRRHSRQGPQEARRGAKGRRGSRCPPPRNGPQAARRRGVAGGRRASRLLELAAMPARPGRG